MELEQPDDSIALTPDQRPRIPEPPPVRLLAVADVRLPAPAGAERQLDQFYVDLLNFEREADSQFPIYRAENFCLIIDVLEPPIRRDDLRPLQIEVLSLPLLERKLIDGQVEYTHRRGLLPGQEALILLDPAGNWIEITAFSQLT